MRPEKHMQKGMQSAILGRMRRAALLAGFVCLAFPAWTSADGLGRQASTGVETTLMEIGTFVGDEFVPPMEPGQLLFEGAY